MGREDNVSLQDSFDIRFFFPPNAFFARALNISSSIHYIFHHLIAQFLDEPELAIPFAHDRDFYFYYLDYSGSMICGGDSFVAG